jgi:dolichol-phosphate mannosyltransferase
MKVSIVIPFHNEAESVKAVLGEILAVRDPRDEIIAVDDGSSDGTGAIMDGLSGITVIHLPRNMGQSAAIYKGLKAATGDVIATLDGDGQNDPADINQLVMALSGADFAMGYRHTRKDTWSKRAGSRLANGIRRGLLHDQVRDSGCGIKAFRREVVEAFIPFNGLHRFMPALAINAGFKVAECPVNHRPRKAGTSKYTNWERGLRGIYDLFGVRWYLKRAVYPTLNRNSSKPHE